MKHVYQLINVITEEIIHTGTLDKCVDHVLKDAELPRPKLRTTAINIVDNHYQQRTPNRE